MKQSKKNSDNKPICKYYNFDVFPAKVFFDVLKSKDYQLLRAKNGVKTDALKAIYEQVYEDYFIHSENEEAGLYVELSNTVKFLTFKREAIKLALAFILSVPPILLESKEVQEIIKSQIEALNKHLDTPIDFDIDLLDEALRVLNVEIGIIQDEIAVAQEQLDDYKTEVDSVISEYYDRIAAMSDVHGRTLDEQMMLPMYVALEKSTRAKINRQKLQRANGKK